MALVIWLLAIPAWAAGGGSQASQPPQGEYRRLVEIQVRDLTGRPLSGIRAEINPLQGRLVPGGALVADSAGVIRFQFQPLATNPEAGVAARDRLLIYRTAATYRLSHPGFPDRVGGFEDEQELADFSDPAYDSFNRHPTTDPLIVTETMGALRDYLVRPEEGGDLESLVAVLLEARPDLVPRPGSLEMTAEGLLRADFEFRSLFDASRFGLAGAARALLEDPLRSALKIARDRWPGWSRIRQFAIRIQAGFGFTQAPLARPITQTFDFRFPTGSTAALLAGDPGAIRPPLLASVDGEPLDLTGNPESGLDRSNLERTTPHGSGPTGQ